MCGKSEKETRESLTKSFPLFHVKRLHLKRYRRFFAGKSCNQSNLPYKALDGSPKSMKYLKGWKDFRAEAKDLVEDATDLLKDYKKIVEKAKDKKKISGDIEDYNDDIKKFEKRYRKLEELQKKL